jgi:hypothetical protein
VPLEQPLVERYAHFTESLYTGKEVCIEDFLKGLEGAPREELEKVLQGVRLIKRMVEENDFSP